MNVRSRSGNGWRIGKLRVFCLIVVRAHRERGFCRRSGDGQEK